MTAILIDKYRSEVFVFADGRLSQGDAIVTDTFNKVCLVDADTIWTRCGDVGNDALFKQLVENNQLNVESVKKITIDGTFYVVRSEGVTVIHSVELNARDDRSKTGMFNMDFDSLPLFDGSGSDALSAAYEIMQPNKSKSRQEYIDRVRQCFNDGCKRVMSVGPLYSFKSIKVRD